MKKLRYYLGRQKKRSVEAFRRAFMLSIWQSMPNKSHERLLGMKDGYKDYDCVIVGNGPSLNKTDLTLLRGKYCFFFNGAFDLRSYTDPDKIIHVCEDRLVFEDHRRQLNSLPGIKIFPSDLLHLISSEDAIVVEFHRGRPEKRTDWPGFVDKYSVCPVFYWGGTVAYLGLQLAQWMGFRRIFIIGVDLNYSIPDTVKKDGLVLTSTEDDPNHYRPSYFGKGLRWHVPMPDRMLRAFEYASNLEINSNVVNAGVGGNLNCFLRAPLSNLTSDCNE